MVDSPTPAGPSRAPFGGWTKKVIAIVIVALFGGIAVSYAVTNAPQGAPPSARFEWTMAQRFGLGTANESAAGSEAFKCYVWPEGLPNSTLCPERPWLVTLDASSSTGSEDLTYSWSAAEAECNPSSGPRIICAYARLGTAAISLSVRDRWGRLATASSNLTLDDTLVVLLGDSVASGEGNPDVPRVVTYVDSLFGPIPVFSDPVWQDRRCHRSLRSGHAQAAKAIEDSDPHSSVTFIDLACSGAGIRHGLLGSYGGQESVIFFCDDPIRDQTCPRGSITGARHICPFPQYSVFERACMEFLAPQIDELERLLCPVPIATDFWGANLGRCPEQARHVDYMMLSVGANDLGFGEIVKKCAIEESCQWELAGEIPALLGDLYQSYDDLSNAIKTRIGVDPEDIYITEYFDPTRDDAGRYCHMLRGIDELAWDMIEDWVYTNPLQTAIYALGIASLAYLFPIPVAVIGVIAYFFLPALDGITPDESKWAYNNIVLPLNQMVFTKAAAFKWTYVGGIMYLFRQHGTCAEDRWIVRLKDSLADLGTIKGTMHPNAVGHQVIRDRLVKFMLEGAEASFLAVPAYNSLLPVPGHVVVSEEGEAGWYVGQCTYYLPDLQNPICNSAAAGFTVWVQDPNFIQDVTLKIDGSSIPDTSIPPGDPRDLTGAGGWDCTSGTVKCNHRRISDIMWAWVIRIESEGARDFEFTAQEYIGLGFSYDHAILVDFFDPTVQGVISGGVMGLNGWYTTPPVLILEGFDTPTGSRMKGIEYSVDGGPAVLWQWCSWVGPQFACLAPVVCVTFLGERTCFPVLLPCSGWGTEHETCQVWVIDDGIHTVEYWAVDFSGRKSPSQVMTLQIDKTAPAPRIFDPAKDGSGMDVFNGRSATTDSIVFEFSATDAIGVVRYECALDDENARGPCTGPRPQTQEYLGLSRGYIHKFWVYAYDDAGNRGKTGPFLWYVP